MSVQLVREWINKAEEDFKVALKLSRSRKDKFYDTICYHSQQCIEKYLKAFLINHKVAPPPIHSLTKLNNLCIKIRSEFEMIFEWLELLTPYAVEIRYPGEAANKEEAQIALKAMKQAREFIREKLPYRLL